VTSDLLPVLFGSGTCCVGEKSKKRALKGGSKIRPGSRLILQGRKGSGQIGYSRMFVTIFVPFPAGPHACSLQTFATAAGGGVWPTRRMTALDYCNCVTVTL